MPTTTNPKIAVIHDWLETYAGAERVLEQILYIYPNSDIYTVVDYLKDEDRSYLQNKKSTTTFIQNLPFAKQKFRNYLPLMPFAIEQIDLSNYDIVISSSYAVAKGVITGPNQLHVCYCHSPIRYAWDLQNQYLSESNLKSGVKSWIVRYILHKLRIWDVCSSNRVDFFVANSHFIQSRIKKAYHRPSSVIYPPVSISKFKNDETHANKEHYITFSRMVPYKRIDLIAETFSKYLPDRKLIIIGEGPQYNIIKQKSGPNIHLLGHVAFDRLKHLLSQAKAFIFAAEEDFGIAPVEAQAAGIPVIAFGKGGALETIVGPENEKPTGVFFNEQSPTSLKQAVLDFEKNEQLFSPQNCIENAKRFDERLFRHQLKEFIEEKYSSYIT